MSEDLFGRKWERFMHQWQVTADVLATPEAQRAAVYRGIRNLAWLGASVVKDLVVELPSGSPHDLSAMVAACAEVGAIVDWSKPQDGPMLVVKVQCMAQRRNPSGNSKLDGIPMGNLVTWESDPIWFAQDLDRALRQLADTAGFTGSAFLVIPSDTANDMKQVASEWCRMTGAELKISDTIEPGQNPMAVRAILSETWNGPRSRAEAGRPVTVPEA